MTNGPFAIVRNPVLACTAITAAGLALLIGNVLSVLMLAAVLIGHQIQVKLVEEPYLAHVHGDAYRTTRRGRAASCRSSADGALRAELGLAIGSVST